MGRIKYQNAADLLTSFEGDLTSTRVGNDINETKKSIMERLYDARNVVRIAEAEVEKAEIHTKHIEKELAATEKIHNNVLKEAIHLQEKIDLERLAVSELERSFFSLKHHEQMVTKLLNEKERKQREIRNIKEKIELLRINGRFMESLYEDHEPNITSAQIKGLVAELIKVDEPLYTTAIEVVAGAILYSLVVDTVKTAEKLISKGALNRRITVIPLDKIKNRNLPQSKVYQIEKYTQGKAKLALEMISFSDVVKCNALYVWWHFYMSGRRNC